MYHVARPSAFLNAPLRIEEIEAERVNQEHDDPGVDRWRAASGLAEGWQFSPGEEKAASVQVEAQNAAEEAPERATGDRHP